MIDVHPNALVIRFRMMSIQKCIKCEHALKACEQRVERNVLINTHDCISWLLVDSEHGSLPVGPLVYQCHSAVAGFGVVTQ